MRNLYRNDLTFLKSHRNTSFTAWFSEVSSNTKGLHEDCYNLSKLGIHM